MNLLTGYEGGFVAVAGDRQAAADWYCRHLGLNVAWDSKGDGQTLLTFPVRYAMPLVSMAGGTELDLWNGPADCVRESNVRMALVCPDLARTHAALAAEGVDVGRIQPGPDGRAWFDFRDLEGTRLTAVAARDASLAAETPDARFRGFAPLRIGVRDWQKARDWYQANLGMKVLQEYPETRAVLMGLDEFEPTLLHTLPEGAFAAGPVSPTVRPQYRASRIEEAHRTCAASGLNPSPLTGEPGGHRAFHFFDPDGNRINVYTYPGAPEP